MRRKPRITRFVNWGAALRVVGSLENAPIAGILREEEAVTPASQPLLRCSVGWKLRSCIPVLGALATVLSLGACGAFGTSGPKASGRTRVEPRDRRVVHEDCPVTAAGAVAEDINGDGRPDRRTAAGGKASAPCRALDFNFDGVIDAWVYLDEAGRVRRRENDYDSDGSVDEVSLYRAGVLVEQQRVTGRAGKLDTWHYFEAGKMARTERDSNGDDYIDQWWEYPAEREPDCPLIHSDVDGDGRPDPGATVDLCRDRYAAGASAAAEAVERSDAVGELPTEVQEVPAGQDEPPAPGAP